MNDVANKNARTTGEPETPVLMGDARRIEHIRKGGNPPLNSENGASPDFGKNNSTSNTVKVKRLNKRQALKLKRNKLRGRINSLRSELSQLEPLLSKIEQQLVEMKPPVNTMLATELERAGFTGSKASS